MDAARGGDDHIPAQARLIGDSVDARAEGVNPFQPFGLRENVPRHRHAKGHEDLRVNNGRSSLFDRADCPDGQIGKAGVDQVFVAKAHGGGPWQQDEDGGLHGPGGFLVTCAFMDLYIAFSDKSRRRGSKGLRRAFPRWCAPDGVC